MASFTLDISDADFVRVIKERSPDVGTATSHRSGTPLDFLGQDVGLSPRESTVLVLVTRGFSNQDIADELYLSINSVKTYIRSAYRKIDVSTRRSMAWASRRASPCPGPESARTSHRSSCFGRMDRSGRTPRPRGVHAADPRFAPSDDLANTLPVESIETRPVCCWQVTTGGRADQATG